MDCTPAQRHTMALNFTLTQRARTTKLGLAPGPKFEQSLAECRQYIGSKQPCGGVGGTGVDQPGGAAEIFIATTGWHKDELLRGLFQEYVDAGLIHPNTILYRFNKPEQPMLPLELAVITGNGGALQAFLEVGADPAEVPSRDWSSTLNTRTKGGKPIANIYDFIDAKVPDPIGAGPLKAAVAEEMMRRRVAAETLASSPGPAAAPRKPRVL